MLPLSLIALLFALGQVFNCKISPHIFLIAATSTFVRFIHFRFGRDYLEYLDARGDAAQKEIVEDEEK